MADDDKTTSSGAAAAVKARRAGTATKVAASAPAPAVTPVPLPSQSRLGVTSDSAPVSTLVGSFVAGHTASEEYVRAAKPGYYSVYPRGARQPQTFLAWNRGQLVYRAYYERFGGDNAPDNPADAVPVNEPGGGLRLPD